MKQSLHTFWFGIREVITKRNFVLLWLIVFFFFFFLFVLTPVWTVSGNTLARQFDIFTVRDYLLLVFLSSLASLFITMQVYVMRHRRKPEGIGTTTVGGLGALFAGIAGTAFCASCLAPLFALLGIGFGGVIFVLAYRFYFVVGITLLMFIAIYLTARKINKVCTSC